MISEFPFTTTGVDVTAGVCWRYGEYMEIITHVWRHTWGVCTWWSIGLRYACMGLRKYHWSVLLRNGILVKSGFIITFTANYYGRLDLENCNPLMHLWECQGGIITMIEWCQSRDKKGRYSRCLNDDLRLIWCHNDEFGKLENADLIS